MSDMLLEKRAFQWLTEHGFKGNTRIMADFARTIREETIEECATVCETTKLVQDAGVRLKVSPDGPSLAAHIRALKGKV